MRQLRVTELATLAESGARPQLLDVREPWEVALGRIELPDATALSIPMMQIPMRLAEIDRTQPVVCICHHGVRSAQVVDFLQRRGWADAYNLSGGIDAWSTLVDPAVPRY